jgi:hypothetical protein
VQQPFIGNVLASEFKSEIEVVKKILDSAVINSSQELLNQAQALLKQLSTRIKG